MIPVANFSPELAEKYLQSSTFAFDIETDTNSYHWADGETKKSSQRGLSYPADIIYISFYAPDLPIMVLEAAWEEEPYLAEIIEDGEFIEAPFTRRKYFFTEDEIEFIFLMFTRYEYTAIAHNFVFDARQILGKFGIYDSIPDGARFWDTQVVNLLGRWLRPVFKDDDLPSLEELEDHYQILDDHQRRWWSNMKSYRDKLQMLVDDTEAARKFRLKVPRHLLYRDEDGQGISPEEGRWMAIHYAAMDSYVAHKIYEQQIGEEKYEIIPTERAPFDSSSWEELLEIDLAYTKWCSISSARGIRCNLPYVREKRREYFYRMLNAASKLGFDNPKDVFIPRRKTWREKYILELVPELRPDEIDNYPFLLTPKGARSMNAESIEYYMKEYPQLASFREYNDADTKFKAADEFLRHAEYDGRIHTNMDRRTVTGRSASSQPNLQNKHMNPDKGESIEDTHAGYLIADDGYLLIGLDYSNAENWIQACYAGDNNLALACAQEDFHLAMAKKYFPALWEATDQAGRKLLRSHGKAFTFGSAYGMGSYAMAKKMQIETGEEWTKERAQAVLDEKARAFEAVALAMERSTRWAEKNGYTTLWTGRQTTILKTVNRHTGKLIVKGYTAWNSLAQGGVGELVVRAILRIWERLRKNHFFTHAVLQVHDEIILQLKLEEYQTAVPIIIEEMSNVMPEEWLRRTTPHIRWLTDLEHASNAKKWGYVPGQPYPFDLKEYVNRWGFHKLEDGMKERPVWINQWGWGDRALAIELGEIAPDEELPTPVPEVSANMMDTDTPPPFDWLAFQHVFEQVRGFVRPYFVRDSVFAFPEGVELQRVLAHRGQDNQFKDIIASLDRLADVMNKYCQWRAEGGGR